MSVRTVIPIRHTTIHKNVRADCVAEVRKEIAAYKRFKALMDEWIDLGIESSKLRFKADKKTGSG